MKLCSKCKVESDDFAKNVRAKDGLQRYCRPCHRQYDRNRWATSTEYRAQRVAKSALARKEMVQKIQDLKAETGCTDCGIIDRRVLDFDHIGSDKIADVSELIRRGHAWPKISAEIAKCEVVCSNCHRIRTWERRESASHRNVA